MAAKIIVLKDDRVVDEFMLSKGRAVIGRRTESDITIVDNSVSGLHASIARRGEKYEIVDMQSTNGVYIDGRKIDRQLLKDGDLMLVGEHYLQYVEGDFQKPAAKGSGVSLQPSLPADEVAGEGYLVVLSGKNKNQQIELTGALTSIGEPGVQMAAISQRPAGYYIVHVDGGKERDRVPLVNQEPIGFRSHRLEHGDKIEVAGVEMQYFQSDKTVIKLR